MNPVLIGSAALHMGDCLDRMAALPENSVDAIVTDPPYGISFMAKHWDHDVPGVDVWQEAMRVLKPGGHALIACGTRTQHRMVVNIEDAGFEIRDVVSWVYGSGFPKSLNISKAIDKLNGRMMSERLELARHIKERRLAAGLSVADVNRHCGGALLCEHWESKSESFVRVPREKHWRLLQPLLSLCDSFEWLVNRIEAEREVVGSDTKARSTSGKSALPTMGGDTVYQSWDITAPATDAAKQWNGWGTALKPACEFFTLARKPLSEKTVAANVLKWGTGGINIDGCRVGTEKITVKGGSKSGKFEFCANYKQVNQTNTGRFPANLIHDGSDEVLAGFPESKETSAARFFYCAKASKADRDECNHHPTVKPTALMAYLCRLITPPCGTVLDPFMGSGSTGKAAVLEGFRFIGIEIEQGYFDIASARISAAQKQGDIFK